MEANLEVLWLNRNEPMATPRYHFLVTPNSGERQMPKIIIGDDALTAHLLEFLQDTTTQDKRLTAVAEWMDRIFATGELSIFHLSVTRD